MVGGRVGKGFSQSLYQAFLQVCFYKIRLHFIRMHILKLYDELTNERYMLQFFLIFFLHVSKIFEFIFSEFETLTNTWCCVVDVLALAASIGELTTLCRKARTANWCALQMADKDNAPLTSLGFEIKTEMTKEGFPVYISQQNVIELQDTEEGQSGENSKA